jgi:hypothetical protein
MLRGRRCHIIVLNVHAPTEDKTDDAMGGFHEEVKRVFYELYKYSMKMLGDFNAEVGKEDILKPTAGNGNLHEISNANGIIVVNFTTSKNLTVKSAMFPHHKNHKYIWTSPDGKTHNQIDHILVDR